MNINEDMNKLKLTRVFIQLVIWDLVNQRTGQKVPAMHFGGKNQIDGILATKDINCHAEIFIPLCSLLGYHILCVVDIKYKALIGEPIKNIQGLKIRLLQCLTPNVRKIWNVLKHFLMNTKWKSKLMQFIGIQTSLKPIKDQEERWYRQYQEITNGNDRKICRKPIMGGIDFSPAMNLCLQLRKTQNLIRRKLKGKRIGKNLFFKRHQRNIYLIH